MVIFSIQKKDKKILLPTCVKICGLKTLEEVEACIVSGANWLGFNCYPPSKRFVTPEEIRKLLSIVPPNIITVGVFVNESLEKVHQIVETTGLQMVQLHGDESPEYGMALKIHYFRAFRVSPQFQLKTIQNYATPYFILDSYHPNFYGGTGDSFNWEIATQAKQFGKLILAGGLNPENVTKAIEVVRPFGVDVCSGVETAPGVKDLQLVSNFISNVRKVEGSLTAF